MLNKSVEYELGTGRKDIDEYLLKFTTAFCRCYDRSRSGQGYVTGVQVYFLGLFDTVDSISMFHIPKRAYKLPPVHGTAKHVRHAVAMDERRVKFKVALIVQDTLAQGVANEDIKEVIRSRDNILHLAE